jgi:hypothetical protein
MFSVSCVVIAWMRPDRRCHWNNPVQRGRPEQSSHDVDLADGPSGLDELVSGRQSRGLRPVRLGRAAPVPRHPQNGWRSRRGCGPSRRPSPLQDESVNEGKIDPQERSAELIESAAIREGTEIEAAETDLINKVAHHLFSIGVVPRHEEGGLRL